MRAWLPRKRQSTETVFSHPPSHSSIRWLVQSIIAHRKLLNQTNQSRTDDVDFHCVLHLYIYFLICLFQLKVEQYYIVGITTINWLRCFWGKCINGRLKFPSKSHGRLNREWWQCHLSLQGVMYYTVRQLWEKSSLGASSTQQNVWEPTIW